MKYILLKNGTIVNSKKSFKSDVLIKDKKIQDVSQNISVKEDYEVIDCENFHILPGIIDSQVHFRDPGLTHKEDLESGSKSALLGGVTSFLEMPNTNPSTTSVEAIEEKVSRGKKVSFVNFGFFMGANGKNIDDLKKIPEIEGCCGIKVFLGSSTGDLLLYEEDKLKEIFNNTNSPIAFHSENELLLKKNIDIRDRAKSVHAHYEWRSEEVAYTSTERLIKIARECERKIHVLHITTKSEIELLSQNKDLVTVEVTPQHLTLSAPEIYNKIGTLAQMNPPIREEFHRLALWKGLKNGTVDVIGSDHAPHTLEEKSQTYPLSPSGMPGVQTTLPIMLNHTNNGEISIEKVVELLCEKPSSLYSIQNKGFIQKGYDADITIVDMSKKVIIKNNLMATKVRWTPFNDLQVTGWPIMTFVNGTKAMEDGKILNLPGAGKPLCFR